MRIVILAIIVIGTISSAHAQYRANYRTCSNLVPVCMNNNAKPGLRQSATLPEGSAWRPAHGPVSMAGPFLPTTGDRELLRFLRQS
jgi:hypothetical protein